MKNKDHLDDLFRTVRDLPADVELSDVEKFILAQPAAIYHSTPAAGGAKGLYTLKNIIAMISSISLIGTAIFFLGKGDPKPSVSAAPLPDTAPHVTPITEVSVPADLSAPGSDSMPAPAGSRRPAYPFPVQSDTAPLSEGLIGPRSLTALVVAFPEAPEAPEAPKKKKSGECDDDRHIISLFSKELRRDGIIRSDVTKFTFRINQKEFYVNGKKQPQKVFEKYVGLFGQQLGRNDARGAEMSASVGPGNCSISLSLDDSWDETASATTSSTVSTSVNTGTSVAVSASNARTLGDFSQVEIRGSAHVKITAGDRFSAESRGRETDPGSIEEKGGRLIISQSSSHGEVCVSLPADRLKSVTVFGSGQAILTTPFGGVSTLQVSGSGNITVEKGIETTGNLDILVQGSGTVSARALKASNVKGVVLGSGEIDASGNAGNLSGSISGSGDINMENLDADSADCQILGSGSWQIGIIRTRLSASIQGSGDVIYSGNPVVEKKISGSGSVDARK